jgi:hypothetical protein
MVQQSRRQASSTKTEVPIPLIFYAKYFNFNTVSNKLLAKMYTMNFPAVKSYHILVPAGTAAHNVF